MLARCSFLFFLFPCESCRFSRKCRCLFDQPFSWGELGPPCFHLAQKFIKLTVPMLCHHSSQSSESSSPSGSGSSLLTVSSSKSSGSISDGSRKKYSMLHLQIFRGNPMIRKLPRIESRRPHPGFLLRMRLTAASRRIVSPVKLAGGPAL